MGRAERLAVISILVGVLVLAIKGAAWLLTGSAALYSDALESTVNVAASAVAFVALHMAAKPADANHPYGHDKAEFFAAVIEGALIVIAAGTIFQHAWITFHTPQPLNQPWQGLTLTAAATVINAVWGRRLLQDGRKLRSAALVADGRHLMSDVVTSAGIIAGVAIAVPTGLWWIDPLLGAVTGVHVLRSGAKMIRESVGGLMDEAPAAEIMQRIRALVGANADGAIEAHDLRTRHTGRLTYLEFHLVVPGAMPVADAHAICDRIEEALKAEMEGLVITIHVEPEGKAHHHGVLVL